VSRFAFALVGAILPIGNHTISEYLHPRYPSPRVHGLIVYAPQCHRYLSPLKLKEK